MKEILLEIKEIRDNLLMLINDRYCGSSSFIKEKINVNNIFTFEYSLFLNDDLEKSIATAKKNKADYFVQSDNCVRLLVTDKNISDISDFLLSIDVNIYKINLGFYNNITFIKSVKLRSKIF
jgi:hypothetical protein